MNEPKAKPRTRKEWFSLGWDILWDWKRLEPHLKKELFHAKSFPLLLICAVIFTAILAVSATSCHATHKLEKVSNDYLTNIAYISGQLVSTKSELDKAKASFDEQKTGYITIIADLKADHNTILQEKNAEIAKIAAERDTAQVRVSQLQSLPDTAFLVYSNANLLTKMEYKDFDVEPTINGLNITNYLVDDKYLIPFDTNRTFAVVIPPLPSDAKSIEKLTIRLSSTIDITNFVGGIGVSWWQPMSGTFVMWGRAGSCLETIANNAITPVSSWTSAPLTISTNVTDVIIHAEMVIFAPGFNGYKDYHLFFTPPNLIGMSKAIIQAQSNKK